MKIDRRTLMKGMLAGGTVLVLGVPPWTFADSPARRAGHCVLLLGDTGVDDAFTNGARAACADMTYEGLQTVGLKGGLLTDMDRMVKLLEKFRGTRWIAVMDDASAAIFLGLARTVGVLLLSMGTHAYSEDGPCQLRQAWVVASPAQSAGGLLASQFTKSQNSFSIIETFLQQPSRESALVSRSAPGFSSYRLAGSEVIHIHCSGLSLEAGCGLLGLATEGWSPIPPGVCDRDSVTRRSENWVESVGYAVTASALGVGSIQESCSRRAFVHRSRNGERIQPQERFVSFVMDV
jgi:hypothetical protein